MTPSSVIPPVPADTNQAAKAAYSRDNFYLLIGDRLVGLLRDIHPNGFHVTGLASHRERPHLAMVTIFQYIENLSDNQAVEATRVRVDWKYALHLSMSYPGLPTAIPCEYRQWALQSPDRRQKLQLILDRLVENRLLVGYPDQPPDAQAVLSEVCSVARLDMLFNAMQLALGALVIRQPEWLRKIALPDWYERYYRLIGVTSFPKIQEERDTLARTIGADAKFLLEAVHTSPTQDLILAEILELKKVIDRQFEIQSGELSWRADGCADCPANRPLGLTPDRPSQANFREEDDH